MHTYRHLPLALLLLVLLPLSQPGHAPHVKKTDSPVLASVGIRSLSVEH